MDIMPSTSDDMHTASQGNWARERLMAGGPMPIFHVVSPQSWVGEDITRHVGDGRNDHAPLTCGRGGGDRWHVERSSGLWPLTDCDDRDALWIPSGLLVAQNAWFAARGHRPLSLAGPPDDWLAGVDRSLTGRAVIACSVSRIRTMRTLPGELGDAPWSQLCGGRIPGFRAARRTVDELRQAVAGAPADSLIQLSGHLPDIREEWCVVVRTVTPSAGESRSGSGGHPPLRHMTFRHLTRAVASGGYCVHDPSGGHTILTVFDGARFDPRNRARAEQLAVRTADDTGLVSASIDVAFARSGDAYVLEADPVWCSAPYAYSPKGMRGFVNAVADSRLHRDADGVVRTRSGLPTPRDQIFKPDPWLIEAYANRYRAL